LGEEPLGICICERFRVLYPLAAIPDSKVLDLVVWQAR